MAAAALTVAPASALASGTPTWESAQTLGTTSSTAGEYNFAAGPAGDAVAVWSNSNHVYASIRPAGGSWSTAQALGAAGDDNEYPNAAVDPNGDVLVVWQDYTHTGGGRVESTLYSAATGTWGAIMDVSAAGAASYIGAPVVAFDGSGNAVAAWKAKSGSTAVVQTADLPAGASAWTTPSTVSSTADYGSVPALAVNAEGDATLLWQDQTLGLETVSRSQGGSWGAAQNIASAGSYYDFQVALDPSGNATAVWDLYYGGYVVKASSRSAAAGTWATPTQLATDGSQARPGVVVGDDGTAYAAWYAYDANTNADSIAVASKPSGGSWSSPASASAAGQIIGGNATSGLAVDPSGDVTVLYTAYVSADSANYVYEATLPAGGSWGAPRAISSGGQFLYTQYLRYDDQGNAVAGWSRTPSGGSTYSAEVAGFDDAGPQLRSLTIPASATTGSPASFSVAPLDVWSNVASTDWDFGDPSSGASNTATGASASHTYSTAGRYTVTVTSTDSLGFTTTQAGTVNVSTPSSSPASTAPAAQPQGGASPPPAPQPQPVQPGASPPQTGGGQPAAPSPPANPAAPLVAALTQDLGTASSMLESLGSDTFVGDLLAGKLGLPAAAPGPGTLTFTQTIPASLLHLVGLARTRYVVVARGSHRFAAAGRSRVVLHPTHIGRRALRRLAHRHISLRVTAVFHPAKGGAPTIVRRHLTLRPRSKARRHRHGRT